MRSVNGTENILQGTGNFVLQSDALPRKVMPMNRTEAEEHLRVIRSLMEKATIYRAISAPTALVGGLASVLFGGWLYFRWRPLPAGKEAEEFTQLFIFGWFGVLAVTGAANSALLWLGARRRGEPFLSPGMRQALFALLPAMLCGAFLSYLFLTFHETYWLPPMWMMCYAVGLLATGHFAPRSIPLLGWGFMLAAFGSTLWLVRLGWQAAWGHGESSVATAANLLMVATFGIFHLIYAACTWPRAGRPENAAGE